MTTSTVLYPKEKRRKEKVNYKHWVDYSLAYDGGGSKFTKYYRSRFNARVFAWWHVHIASWGGTAVLFTKGETNGTG